MGEKCIICYNAFVKYEGENPISVSCENCGKFILSDSIFKDLLETNYLLKERHLISGYLRERTDKGFKNIISSENISYLYSNGDIPKTIQEKLDKLLLYCYRNTNKLGEKFYLNTNNNISAIGYAHDMNELQSMLNVLRQKSYIVSISFDQVLTIEGINYAEKLQNNNKQSKQCFVAMWYSDEMRRCYEDYIKKCIEEGCKYKAMIIIDEEHNNDICDEIIAQIRKSKFIIADFTGDRGGVYFEAGFALGLGIPVIWTCKKEWFKSIHFDVNHFNFIVWEDGDDLFKKLNNRIESTIV